MSLVPRTLIMTLPPFAGGVPTKAAILARWLRDRGHAVTIGYYATLHDHPELTQPSWRLLSGPRPATRATTCFGDFPAIAVGCRFPELEFPYYAPSPRWSDLIATHDRHIAIGGTALISHPLARAGIPHLTWCACSMIEDRRDRHAAMPLVRRLVDRFVTIPVQRRMEAEILRGQGRILTVARSGRESLIALGGDPSRISVMPVPVPPQGFSAPDQPAPRGTVGFLARLTDPRKNVGLLIDAVALANRRGAGLRLRLGGAYDSALATRATKAGLGAAIDLVGEVPQSALADFYRSLDFFAIPSHQEGLAIVGIEALASGLPVVSTRCGGPEDYVIDGRSGVLVESTPESMADALVRLTSDRDLRARLALGARAIAMERYSLPAFGETLAAAWHEVWGETP